jgi:hypothetical protein
VCKNYTILVARQQSCVCQPLRRRGAWTEGSVMVAQQEVDEFQEKLSEGGRIEAGV